MELARPLLRSFTAYKEKHGSGLGKEILCPLYNQISDFQVAVGGKTPGNHRHKILVYLIMSNKLDYLVLILLAKPRLYYMHIRSTGDTLPPSYCLGLSPKLGYLSSLLTIVVSILQRKKNQYEREFKESTL